MSKLRQQTNADDFHLLSGEDVSSSHESSADDPACLAPPRPRFMTTAEHRSSWSSITSYGISENSDNYDRERSSPTTIPMSLPQPPPPLRSPTSQTRLRGRSFSQDSQEVPIDPTPMIFMRRPPPSSFSFPFQSHPGNPDPLPPRSLGRNSVDSSVRERPTSAQGFRGNDALPSPYAPFMGPPPGTPPSPASTSSHTYRNSVAGNLAQGSHQLPRTNSVPNFRSPFLSPASRPSSTIWSPPVQPLYGTPTASISQLGVVRKSRPPIPSTMLPEKLTDQDKPWLRAQKGDRSRLSWWVTVSMWFLGLGLGALKVYFDYTSIHVINGSQLCPVFIENFDSLDLTNNWTPDVELNGFGNDEFEMTTTLDKNIFVQNGQLYISPTLTSDEIGNDAIFNGGTYTLDGCTNSTTSTSSSCSVTSDPTQKIVIPPVQSARISTKNSYSIRYGKVEVKAKLPRGDWLWPAVWMLPVDSVYGDWPASGEIDIMEARGNGIQYPGQGLNFVRSSLNYGPFTAVLAKIYGWQSTKRVGYDEAFHTYTLEWTDKWLRVSVDNRINAMLDLTVTGKGNSFWDRGKFPKVAQNGSTEVVVNQIYNTTSSPFDQQFYLIINLSAGGTSGWFPDGVGNKPWYDNSETAKYDFAMAQNTWASTWPSDVNQRAFRIEYVKMWQLGGC